MMCLNFPMSPTFQLKILENEGPTISAPPKGKVRVRLLPVNAVGGPFRVSPYQVSRSPPESDRLSQGKVFTGRVRVGKRSKRPYFPWELPGRAMSRYEAVLDSSR